jgi:hypothetical protein
MAGEELFAMVFILGMFAGVFIVYMGLRQRSMQIEMQHRERMAMIERGQIPLSEPTHARHAGGDRIVVGLGIALMTVISIAGESPETGVGVGGAIAILGGAFIVRSFLVRPPTASPSRSYLSSPPPPQPPAIPRSDAPPDL